MTNRIPRFGHLGLRAADGALRPKPLVSRRLLRNSLPALLALGGLLASSAAEAQTCPPGKSCYYVPPILQVPIIAPQNYGGDLVFYAIGSDVTGTYSFNGGAPVPFTALAGTPLAVPFSGAEGTISGFLVPENRGAFVVSDSPSIIVEQRVTAASWQASATIKNQFFGLGTRFRAGSYPLNNSNADDTGYDFLSFYAPSATSVTVTAPPGEMAPFWNDGIAGLTHTFSLNAGETYALRTRLGKDFDGALITSTQPISVMTGGRGWVSGCGDEGRDHLVPTNLLGTQFVVDDYPSNLSEGLRVVTDTDNTQVSINGVVSATINAGQFYQPAISGVTFIETSQPAYVFQNAGFVQCELDIAMIPPIAFTPLASSSISVNVLGTGHTIIYLPTAAAGSVLLDGAPPPAPQVTAVPTHPEYSRVRFDLSGGDHVVTAASDFQIGVVSFAPGGTGLFAYFNPYRLTTCGNSLLNGGEGCDDGNFDDGDGCNSNCEVEANYVCTGEPSVCVLDPCLGVVCEPLDDCHDAGECDPGTGQCSNPEKVNGSACDDGDSCTQLDSCQAGACTSGTPVTCTAQDQCHDPGTCNPTTGVCSNPIKPDGATCNDGDACTQTDSCQAGACNGANPVTCTALDQCHDAGTCNPGTGTCSNPNKADGTTCNDDNACTQTDACQAGTCTGANPVTCTAQDQCHDAGTCNPATGTCSNPNKPDGTNCNDNNACTQTDSCQAGTCAGGNPVTCTAQDQCHDAGTCNPATGACSNPNKPDGTTCNDGNACTQTDACQAGACNGANPITCTAQDQCHDVGTCNPATGTCSNPNKPDGTTCNDGNACTQTDACQAGTCTGGNNITCTAQDQCHDVGTCNPATGTCSNPAKPDGANCNDGNACTQTDSCQAGTCNGANPVTCTVLDQCHDAGTCNPLTGECSNPNKPDGTTCNDGNACTQTDACQTGTCTGANPITCTAQDQCHDAGTCNPATGTCSNPNKPDGTTCNDGNACTQTDACQTGTCTGGNPITCTAQDQCHDIGTCNPATGTCSNPNKPNGTTCNDGNACTQTDACQAGTCSGSNPVTCTAQDQCHDAGTCNPATGACSNPNKPDGTNCNDGNACTQTDACQTGTCTGANPITCTAQDQCHDAGTCNPATGTCSNPNKPDGTNCNDNNACTQTDACQTGTCTGANPVTCTAQDQCHDVGTCNPATGTCSNPTKPDGTTCNDGNACTQTDACQAGACNGANPVTCTALDQCHNIGACDPATGTCTNPIKPDGASCNDGVACTKSDICTVGICGGTMFTCTPTVCQISSTCDGNGGCLVVNQPAGTPCPDDGNACTLEACDGAGKCAQTLAPNGSPCETGKVCNGGMCNPACFIDGTLYVTNAQNPLNRCQICNPSVSTTAWSNASDGTLCDNGDGCTKDDVCKAGQCVGTPVTCMAMDQCHDAGTCDPTTGACSNPPKADGTECDDNSKCTTKDVCTTGICAGSATVDCTPINECHEAGTCDPATGECSSPEKPDGTECTGGVCQKGECDGTGGAGGDGGGGAGGAGGVGGAGGTGGGGEGGGSGDEPLVGRGGACLCTTTDTRTSPQGVLAFLGMALLSLTRRAKRARR